MRKKRELTMPQVMKLIIHHEGKANAYLDLYNEMDRKDRLIGFKYKNREA